MTSGVPLAPQIARGGIVAMDPYNPLAAVVVFQYNPAEIVRTLVPAALAGQGTPTDTNTLIGPPRETISATLTIDAYDQISGGDVLARTLGLYPQLSALEMLMYPKSAQVIANTALAALGTLEVVPPRAPLTLFVWGEKRVTPVTIEGLTITEQLHDPSLNPILATAQVSLRVLTYQDFTVHDPGYYAFLSYQIVKESMATLGTVSDLSAMPSTGSGFS